MEGACHVGEFGQNEGACTWDMVASYKLFGQGGIKDPSFFKWITLGVPSKYLAQKENLKFELW